MTDRTEPGAPIVLVAVLLAAVHPSASGGDPATHPRADDGDGTVIVTRGTQTQAQVVRQKPAAQRSHAAPAAQTEQGVVVMRPAPGAFMRETSRLAAEADEREQRAAREEAREANRQLTKTMQAVEDAARAAEEEARTRSERYYPVYVPRRHAPQAVPEQGEGGG